MDAKVPIEQPHQARVAFRALREQVSVRSIHVHGAGHEIGRGGNVSSLDRLHAQHFASWFGSSIASERDRGATDYSCTIAFANWWDHGASPLCPGADAHFAYSGSPTQESSFLRASSGEKSHDHAFT